MTCGILGVLLVWALVAIFFCIVASYPWLIILILMLLVGGGLTWMVYISARDYCRHQDGWRTFA